MVVFHFYSISYCERNGSVDNRTTITPRLIVYIYIRVCVRVSKQYIRREITLYWLTSVLLCYLISCFSQSFLINEHTQTYTNIYTCIFNSITLFLNITST